MLNFGYNLYDMLLHSFRLPCFDYNTWVNSRLWGNMTHAVGLNPLWILNMLFNHSTILFCYRSCQKMLIIMFAFFSCDEGDITAIYFLPSEFKVMNLCIFILNVSGQVRLAIRLCQHNHLISPWHSGTPVYKVIVCEPYSNACVIYLLVHLVWFFHHH